MPKICITKRPATELAADAIVIPIKKDGSFHGETHRAIIALVGDHFHSRIPKDAPLIPGSAFYVRRMQMFPIRFDGVIFVVEDPEIPTLRMLTNAFEIADREHMRMLTVVLPFADIDDVRVGGIFEQSCYETRAAIHGFHQDHPNAKLHLVNVFIGRDYELLARAMDVI